MKFTLTLTLFFLIVTSVNGQESKKYMKLKRKLQYQEGYIVSKDSIKVEGLIKDQIMNENKKFSKVTFVQKDGTKESYFPNEIRGFGYSMYRYVSDSSSFYEILSKTKKIGIYRKLTSTFYTTPSPFGTFEAINSSTLENLYIKRDSESTFKLVRRRNFIEDFSEYFKDCPEIVEKITTKEYTHKDIKKIVSLYNRCK